MNALKKEKLKKNIWLAAYFFTNDSNLTLSLQKEMMYYYSSDFLKRPKQFDENFPFA